MSVGIITWSNSTRSNYQQSGIDGKICCRAIVLSLVSSPFCKWWELRYTVLTLPCIYAYVKYTIRAIVTINQSVAEILSMNNLILRWPGNKAATRPFVHSSSQQNNNNRLVRQCLTHEGWSDLLCSWGCYHRILDVGLYLRIHWYILFLNYWGGYHIGCWMIHGYC